MPDQTDLQLLDALIAAQEKKVQQAFRLFIATVGSGIVLDAIVERLILNDVEGALAIVDSYVASMANVLPAIAADVGTVTADELSRLIPNSAISIGFDPTHPRAAEIIRDNRLQFVRDFTAQQRTATLQALNRGYQEGMGTAETARLFRGSIGLTPQQEQAVASYRRALELRNSNALQRQLRDRRFDRSVQSAIDNDRPIPADRIDRMVNQYRTNFLASRSETIARTEGVRATSQAREESLDQMIEQSGTPVDSVERIWNPTRDNRTRDWHASMANQRRSRTEPFKDGLGNSLMYPGDPHAPAVTVINCRCGLTFSIKAAA